MQGCLCTWGWCVRRALLAGWQGGWLPIGLGPEPYAACCFRYARCTACLGCRFKQDVEEKDLTGVVVPEVLHATPEVLVTQWIEGEQQGQPGV